MALPAGIATTTITFGTAVSMISAKNLTMSVTFTPTTSLVWAATGTVLIADAEGFTADPGTQGSVTLINPDQAGFADGNGNTIRNFGYKVEAAYSDGKTVLLTAPTKYITWTAADTGPLDLDQMIPVTASSGITVSMPLVTSVNGHTGDVTVSGSSPISDPAAILQGVGLYAAGDSYLAADVQNTAGKRYVDQLTAGFGMTLINTATGGNFMQDVANKMANGTTPAPGAAAPSATPRYLIEGGLNDLMNHDVDPGTRDNFATALEASIWMACAQPARIENSDARWLYTGSWSSYNDASASGGTGHVTDQGPATDRASITPGAGDYIYMSIGIQGGLGATFQTGAVTVGGTQVAANIIQNANGTINGSAWLNIPIPLIGIRAGQTITVTAAGGGYTFIDCLLKLNDIAPWIIVMKPAYVPNASTAAVDLYRAAVDRTVAKVSALYPPAAGKIITVDPVTMGWDQGLHVGADGIHPNNAGEDLLYSCITARVGTAIARRTALIDSGFAS